MNGNKTRESTERAAGTLFPNYRQFPVVFARGKGTRLWDTDGREYTDFVAGIATCNLGHCHPEVTKAICEQAERLVHVSNWYFSQSQIQLLDYLPAQAGLERVFFCNSGAEASEAAIKLARKRAYEKYGPGRSKIISLFRAFHGRTMKALMATDPHHHNIAFSPLPEGFVHINAGDVPTLEKFLPEACAVFLEVVQGEGGVHPIDPAFLKEVERLCKEYDVLFMLDEVQTGMGRCGALFAHQALGIKPDLMTLAKGLANGFPMGAVLAREEVAQTLGPGTHGSTFGGNPLACAAALATLKVLVQDALPSRARSIGLILRDALESLASERREIVQVRGMGLLLGLELAWPAADVARDLMKRGYLVTVVAGNTLRFTPALTITEEEIEGLMKVLGESITSAGGNS
ncbi:MAG: acetylornithine/succinylornithine family transaminase [Proteobacteria bacterium]|nr:acetylornithine/succinylornithine family transaminase [Pseudomonadota bacterium]